MRNSWKLGVCAALCASVAFIGCSDDDDDSTNTGGSGGASGGKAGQANAGSTSGTAGNASAGKGGGGTPAGGNGGKGGAGGNAGSAVMGGEGGGLVDAGGAGGAGGVGGDSGVECTDEELGAGGAGEGGAGGASAVTAAVVLIDSVVVDGAQATLPEWQFDDGTTISDETNYPADKWSRIIFDLGSLGDDPGAHATFLACDGNPTDGSLKAVVPFSDVNQYFELGCPFAADDFSGATITAKVKLISGGKPDAACPVRGQLYTTGGTAQDGAGFALVEGEWVTLTLAIPAGTTMVDRVGVRLNTYGC
jgi:hypothetical protein